MGPVPWRRTARRIMRSSNPKSKIGLYTGRVACGHRHHWHSHRPAAAGGAGGAGGGAAHAVQQQPQANRAGTAQLPHGPRHPALRRELPTTRVRRHVGGHDPAVPGAAERDTTSSTFPKRSSTPTTCPPPGRLFRPSFALPTASAALYWADGSRRPLITQPVPWAYGIPPRWVRRATGPGPRIPACSAGHRTGKRSWAVSAAPIRPTTAFTTSWAPAPAARSSRFPGNGKYWNPT